MIKRLRKKHRIICTSRNYREVIQLARILKLNLEIVGKHGGGEKYEKLNSSLKRMVSLSNIIERESPDFTVSFCSPEAARISYGLGIKHIAFSDSPHAEAVMRLTIPLVQKLLTPWIIPKVEFSKFGISSKNIHQYKAIDAAAIAKRKIKIKKQTSEKRKTIVIRVEEDQAAYSSKKSNTIHIINEIANEFNKERIIVLSRYLSQIKFYNKKFGKKVKILSKVVDGKSLLLQTNVFVGSGGTMTAESALLGIPTISYNAVPNFIERYLVSKKLVKRETDPEKIAKTVRRVIDFPDATYKKKALKVLKSMEDPYTKLLELLG